MKYTKITENLNLTLLAQSTNM